MADTYLSQEDFRAFVASLPRRRLAAGALITDPDGSVLVAKPNYKDGWTLPGGTVEAGEAPGAIYGFACGLDMTRRDLQQAERVKQRPWDLGKDFEGSAVI